jgi:hypothetical protein
MVHSVVGGEAIREDGCGPLTAIGAPGEALLRTLERATASPATLAATLADILAEGDDS